MTERERCNSFEHRLGKDGSTSENGTTFKGRGTDEASSEEKTNVIAIEKRKWNNCATIGS